MKLMRWMLGLAALSLLTAAAGAAGFGGRSGGGHASSGSRSSGGTRVFKQRHVSVSRPAPAARGAVGSAGRSQASGAGRGSVGARGAAHNPPGHATIVGNRALVGRITDRERTETVAGRYYWHNDGGARYVHYFWGGAHWYGFNYGRSFYWTRYYGDRWWWYDVYVDNGYYPYDEAAGAVTVQTAEDQKAPEKAPDAKAGTVFPSPDGRRQVQVYGTAAQAFLYDKTGDQAQYVKFLGEGVEKVRFTGASGGKALQILLEFKDGTFAVYDEDGNSIDSAAAAPSASDSPVKDEGIPGPPPGLPPLPPPAGTNAIPATSTGTATAVGASSSTTTGAKAP
jgi:hypothetical protein